MIPATMCTVRSELLDCIQSNLALLADCWHGPETHLVAGATLRFQPRPGAQGLPTVEPAMPGQLAEACDHLGLRVARRWSGLSVARLRRLCERHGTLYAIGDSHGMSWLPYHRRRHMDHSFLVSSVDGASEVTDAYHNQTEWGPADPGRWRLRWAELPAASLVLHLEPAPTGPTAVAPSIAVEPPEDYLNAYARHPDRTTALSRLTVETWLLARSRGLHAAYRARPGSVDQRTTDHLRRWNQVASQAFLAMRRLRRGKPEPNNLLPAIATVIADDQEIFGGRSPTTEGVPPRWTPSTSTC